MCSLVTCALLTFQAITSRFNIWRMVFFTPKQKAMQLEDALKTGYGVTTTKSRLVLRSGYDMPETYVENVSGNSSATFISLLRDNAKRARAKVVPALQVNGVPMKIIRVTTYFKRQWSVTMLDTVAACPTGM